MAKRIRRYRGMKHVWSIDTEFQLVNRRPVPVCLCAEDTMTGQRIEMFFHDGERPPNPFDDYEHSLFIGHSLAAEWQVFIALDWELPPYCIDTIFEFGNLVNGKYKRDMETRITDGLDLPSACDYFGVSAMDHAAKTVERDNIIAHGRSAPEGVEQADHERRILDYCWQDVTQTAALFKEMVDFLDSSQAMLRGSYSRSVAWYQFNGLPLDLPKIKKVFKYKDHLKLEIIRGVEEKHNYGVYKIADGVAKFDHAGAAAMIERMGLGAIWPRTPSSQRFSFSKESREAMMKPREELLPLHELMKTDAALKNFGVRVSDDGYNRAYIAPFGTKTGRNNPRGGLILAGPKWLRYYIRAPPDHTLIVCDVKSEEYVIVAAFADDQEQLEPYYAGEDLYLKLAKRRKVVPEDANHEKEPDEKKRKHYGTLRKLHKGVQLASIYGQRSRAVAAKLGIPQLEADILDADIRRINKKWWDCSASQIGAARKKGYIETVFGWRMHVYPEIRLGPFRTLGTKTTTLINWPIQAAGAEIMRIASILLERGGYGPYFCVPHHDAIYAMAPKEKAREVAIAIEAAFSAAGDIVLDGKARLLMDAKPYPHPQTYEDKDGADLFKIVDNILSGLPEVTDEEWAIIQATTDKKIEENHRKKRGSTTA